MLDAFPYDTVLITGGTGSFGTAFLRHLRTTSPQTKARIFSRDELKQSRLRQELGDDHVSYLLGDVRDLERLRLACRNVDLVVHAAALKQVPAGENNPLEFLATNVQGTANVVRAAIDCGVQQALLLSTDKACAPITTYGACKLMAERLFLQANTYTPHGTRFTALRYGNVAASRGSVLEIWQRCRAVSAPLPLTHLQATRFWLTLSQAIGLVEFVVRQPLRGYLVVPYLPAFAVLDLARAVLDKAPEAELHDGRDILTIGIRGREKLHEALLSQDEHTPLWHYLLEDTALPYAYAVPPQSPTWEQPPLDQRWHHVPSLTTPYTSDAWPWRLTVDELRARLARLEEGV